MSGGHQHLGGPHMTQNQGNVLGDRPCVRQSMLYRQHVGGNEMKGILGQDTLQWDTTRTQGAYEGGRVYDHNTQSYNQQQQQQQQYQQPPPQQQQQQYQPAQAPLAMGQPQYQQAPQQQYQQAQAPLATGQPQQQQQQQQQQEPGHRRGAGSANRQTYNILTGQ